MPYFYSVSMCLFRRGPISLQEMGIHPKYITSFLSLRLVIYYMCYTLRYHHYTYRL